MLDILQTKLELASLNSRIRTWAKVVGLSLKDALVKQAGLLKWELMAGAPPKNLRRSKQRGIRDASLLFHPRPRDYFRTKKQRGRNGIIWLYATPQILYGVQDEDYRPEMTLTDALQIKSGKPFRFERQNKWQDLGQVSSTRFVKAGKFKRSSLTAKGRLRKGVSLTSSETGQKAIKVNRTIITQSTFRKLQKHLSDQFGKLKAAWVVDLSRFKVARAIPEWVMKHVRAGRARGFTVMQLNGPKPYIQIISRAHGVEHKASINNARRAARKRLGAMLADMRLHLRGVKKQAGFKHA